MTIMQWFTRGVTPEAFHQRTNNNAVIDVYTPTRDVAVVTIAASTKQKAIEAFEDYKYHCTLLHWNADDDGGRVIYSED